MLCVSKVEQLSQLAAFVDAEVIYHQHSLDILLNLQDAMRRKLVALVCQVGRSVKK